MFYLMTWRETGCNISVTIYGPYTRKADCTSAGRIWEKVHDDNPCWQILTGELSINIKPAE